MSQVQIQVVDARDELFIVVEQTFDDRPEADASDATKWTNPGPVYSLTNLAGEFLTAVVKRNDGMFVNELTGDVYNPVGT
jgi:hypothetical protein